MMLHILSLTALLAAVSAQQQQQCSENEALLKVSYKLKEEEWDEKLPAPEFDSYYPLLSIQPSGTVLGNYSSAYEELLYTNYSSLTDYETCIPRDVCLQVIVGMLPIDSYDIIWDGEAMQTGQAVWDTYWKNNTFSQEHLEQVMFPVTSTDIGMDCFPTCEEDEGLFDHQQYTTYMIQRKHGIRVEDGEGNTVIDSRDNRDTLFFKYRTCLKVGKCYSFLIGSRYKFSSDNHSYSLRYNKELIAQSDNWRVDQVYFGSGCQSKCNEEDESQVEILAYPNYLGSPRSCSAASPGFSWNVSNGNAIVSNNESVASGIFHRCGANKTLYHETVCVPKDSCSSFNLSPHEEKDFMDDLSYVILMDDTMYRNSRWDTHHRMLTTIKNELTLLGKCTQSDCAPEEDLIEVSFSTPAKYVKYGANQSAIDSASSPGYGQGIDWKLDYMEYRYYVDELPSSRNFVESVYELDTKYRALMCIPSSNCEIEVQMSADAPVVDYKVEHNGEQVLTDIRPLAPSKPTEYLILAAPLGENCNNSLSGGAIAGIVIGSIVGFLALSGGGYMLYRKKYQSNQVS